MGGILDGWAWTISGCEKNDISREKSLRKIRLADLLPPNFPRRALQSDSPRENKLFSRGAFGRAGLNNSGWALQNHFIRENKAFFDTLFLLACLGASGLGFDVGPAPRFLEENASQILPTLHFPPLISADVRCQVLFCLKISTFYSVLKIENPKRAFLVFLAKNGS
jgi:hypothetical protein